MDINLHASSVFFMLSFIRTNPALEVSYDWNPAILKTHQLAAKIKMILKFEYSRSKPLGQTTLNVFKIAEIQSMLLSHFFGFAEVNARTLVLIQIWKPCMRLFKLYIDIK